jgi:hypothetical protein
LEDSSLTKDRSAFAFAINGLTLSKPGIPLDDRTKGGGSAQNAGGE